jgi:hypothetical protein
LQLRAQAQKTILGAADHAQARRDHGSLGMAFLPPLPACGEKKMFAINKKAVRAFI